MIASLLVLVAPLQTPHAEGTWHAWLDTPGGKLLFDVHLARREGGWTASLVNGEERIEVPEVACDGRELLLSMPHYDSRIRARLEEHGWTGSWEKRRSATEVARVPFGATAARVCENPSSLWGTPVFSGRWAVDFATDERPAVAVFEECGSQLEGTFLTATGDYRYLDGSWTPEELALSCFDGAHAFLFKAKLQPDGTLAGDFWSGNWHHETWTAKRDPDAQLDDPFGQTRWNGRTKLADLVFPDLDGTKRSLGDFAGKATLLVVLGSWCPNCNDEAKLLAELDRKYGKHGLRILGLAFELTGEFQRDAKQVKIFAERHQLALPFFLGGTADKEDATRALGLVDRVRAFPTTVFVGADGLPRAIHSGFAGPATGEEHARLRREFEARIEALLEGR
jgi:thiol-disulfide isomerase/thioredoxin